MIKIEEVEKLAKLARIEITDREKEQFQKEIGSILDYVSELKEAPSAEKEIIKKLENVNKLREDINPHETGIYSRELLEGAPRSEKGFVKVKKIFE
ncbi:MAG: Asp-tRNA(Asn)/Glu-tRNA(Gln) amidotransferase subunit GatC [Parcubacteria group bacterium]|nr:Asp-tRNA(Asn)/Glu-tRNA(Gln) amidotransferase subunit GatC [Parcubacteria group bacterium]MCR4342743.1 Asp-tRNA(Asn)/Glu-tRNA(Gln) amidotransferase subunit GatC [Patescibacteria group bacterium]